MTNKNYMAQLGATLVDRGFPILPIQPNTKKPGLYKLGAWHEYPKWSRHCERDTTDNEVDVWGNWPEAGIGIAAGRVIGIDIDVLDSPSVALEIEALAKRMLGDTPAVRIGHAPKRLLVYRAVQPFSGFKYPPIEVLGSGQQFIAYGIHPDTGKPYDWPVSTLADLSPDDLPGITEAQAREFAKEAYRLIPADLRPKSLGVGLRAPIECANLPEQRGTFEAVEDALRHIVNADLDYDSWVRIGMAIKGALGDDGWPLFEAWSQTSQKNEPKTTARSWRSFAPQRIGAGTIYKLALDSGWEPDAQLQLNGEIVMNGHHPARELLNALQAADPISLEPAQVALPPPKPMPAGWDQVGGVIADMMTLMAATAKRPQPVLALGASLCAIGALMGRKYRTESNIRSNLYVVGIAESGAGKNHSRVVINELFRKANLLQYLGGNKIASGAGLLTAIQRQPAILFQLDEFGMFLSAAADRKRSPRYVCEILDLMTELYTTSGTTYFGVEYASTQNNNAHRAIHQPCACIYGTTTPLHFWQALQASNVADGSLARFLIMESEDDFPDSNEAFGIIDPPQDLIDRLILIHQGGGKLNGNLTDVGAIDEVLVDPRVVPMTPQARATFRLLDQELVERLRTSRGTGFSSILARIEENATKLALIRAVSRDPVDPQIEDHDAEWGINLSRHCAELTIREASARVSENQVESHHKRAMQILRDAGMAGMSKSDFTRRTQFMDHRQRDGVLRTLAEAGLIETMALQSKGRPAQWIKVL
ncbi:PriCT-2 domain-containing protein [Laribacter hongkongensis]|uniref:PriCT-2 domain-containing protein n=1 Tax=Laribacter hongkongensis TaxID=168471 RepID=UPI001EFE736B|nr:PriCT-2 domain-containing protein [Laribacter hongkongensis]MCG9087809.1 PriCT-2 domain-containing protein [Laribacter hongkongensis]